MCDIYDAYGIPEPNIIRDDTFDTDDEFDPLMSMSRLEIRERREHPEWFDDDFDADDFDDDDDFDD